MAFGDWLRTQLVAKGWSQADLARTMGRRPIVISNWISGRQRPTPRSCEAISQALDVSYAVVLRHAGHPVPDDMLVPDEMEDQLVSSWRQLSPEQREGVLEFVLHLRAKSRA